MTAIKDQWESPDGSVRLLLGDCLEILPTLDVGSVGACVTDPPYGAWLSRNNGKRGLLQRAEQLGSFGVTSAAKTSGRICEPIIGDNQSFDPKPFLSFDNVILWGANWYASQIPDGGGWLVWDKRGGIRSNNFGDAELAWCKPYRPIRILTHRWNGMIRDSNETLEHPTQKPLQVMLWCINFFQDSKVIFDPFMGSGTTGVACIRTERRFIGIEIERKYFDIAVERCKRELERFPLFEKTKPKQLELI